MAGTNPKAGSASVPGAANTPYGNAGGLNDLSGAYRAQDGPIVGGLTDRLRVKGSQPPADPRDPQSPQP